MHSTSRLLLITAVTALISAIIGVAVGVGVVDRDGGTSTAGQPAAAVAPDFTDIIRQALPSVVRIDVRGIEVGSAGNASGVVIDGQGHIVTNHHVVAGATSIVVTSSDNNTARARLIGSDPRTDLAVIEVEESPGPAITVADPDGLAVGQPVVALGSPFGLDGSATAGIISALDRTIDLRGGDGVMTRLPGVLQTDAGINPGNSGGPLLNADGQLVGVNSSVLGEDFGGDVGFAIPAATVATTAAALIADGQIQTPYLGVALSDAPQVGATDTDTDGGSEPPGGALIERVDEGTPAALGGLAANDVIVAVNDTDISGVDSLVAAVTDAGVGATIDISYVRDRQVRVASITLTDTD